MTEIQTSSSNPFDDSFDKSSSPNKTNETPYKPIIIQEDQLLASATDRELRAKRLKEEGVRRLVADINRTASVMNPMTSDNTLQYTNTSALHQSANHHRYGTTINTDNQVVSSDSEQQSRQQDELLVASTIATAIERNLDRELHTELTKQMKESASTISKICHEHSDDFLLSVGKVVTLGQSCGKIRLHIDEANEALQLQTGEPMLKAASQLEYTKNVVARARTVHGIVSACKDVAVLLERARKQADLARPRTALDAVDEARSKLTAPLSMVVGVDKYQGIDMKDMKAYFDALMRENEVIAAVSSATDKSGKDLKNINSKNDKKNEKKIEKGNSGNSHNSSTGTSGGGGVEIPRSPSGVREENSELRLDDTPFGARAMAMLPIIENEVLMGARRGLNKWFLSIRSGGDGAKAGRAALRKCARSMAIGPGQLGLGGDLQGYTWRAKNADNLIARVSQSTRVSRAARMGYWFERDHPKELKRLEKVSRLGMERRAEAFASAFGWYRSWEEDDPLEVEDLYMDGPGGDALSRSGHALSRSGHSSNRSSHGLQTSSSRQGRSLGFRSTRRDDSLTRQSGDIKGRGKKTTSQWSEALTPSVLFDNAPNKVEDEAKLVQIPNSVYPVRRAEAAFALLGKSEEFAQYYETNRFGVTKIGEKDEGGFGKETRSSLSSLTGDDVSQGTDRIFFSRSLPHFCTSVIGFSTIEAALELGNFQNDESGDSPKSNDDVGRIDDEPNVMSFRESSARYERKLISELGSLLRSRAIRATLVELTRASCLMAAFRSALKIVHPSSATRSIDKELIAMDVDILMTGLKVSQEEQRRATARIIFDDNKEPMPVPVEKSNFRYASKQEDASNIPNEEVKGFPFGLAEQKEKDSFDRSLDEFEGIQTRRSSGIYNRKFDEKEKFKFSSSVPLIVRSIHSRAIAFAAFASSQEELGQVFVSKKGGGISGYVLDCVEQLIVLAAVGMKENNGKSISTVQEAVQVMSNINALKTTLPRLFGVIMRGLFHLGMAKGDQLEESFEYAESILVKADEYCDNQTKSMFNVLYNICQNKIDELLRFSLENFQWVTRTERDSPNTYCESLIDYLRNIFKILKMLEEGPKAMLYFSTCGHITERMVQVIAGKIEENDKKSKSSSGLSPISKIDAFGLKNLSLDVQALETFADGTGLPQLRTCFNELRWLTDALLDPDLPRLLNPENENARRRKHPFLQLDLIANVLEKYQGSGGLGGKFGPSGGAQQFLILEKKEIVQLLKIVKAQL